MNKKITLALLGTLLMGSLCAQEVEMSSSEDVIPSRNNVIKTKPIRTMVGLIPVSSIPLNLTYERALGSKISLSANIIFGPKRQLSRIMTEANTALSTGIDPAKGYGVITSLTTNRLYLSPEFRFYPGKKGAPRGFYLSVEPYYSSLKTIMAINYGYIMDVNTSIGSVPYLYNNNYDLTVQMKNFGAVIGIGNQWLIGDRVALDILWLGFGGGMGSISTGVDGTLIDQAQIEADLTAMTGQPVDMTDDDTPTWKTIADGFDEGIGQVIAALPYIGNKISFVGNSNSVSADFNGFLGRLRLLNISLGVAF